MVTWHMYLTVIALIALSKFNGIEHSSSCVPFLVLFSTCLLQILRLALSEVSHATMQHTEAQCNTKHSVIEFMVKGHRSSILQTE